MNRCVVLFDLDGVLIDAWELVRASYEYAGVMPPDDRTLRGVAGHVWIGEHYPKLSGEVIADTHHVKDLRYLAGLLEGRFVELPPLAAARRLKRMGHEVGVLTGAPLGTRRSLLRNTASSTIFADWPRRFDPWYEGIGASAKGRALSLIGSTYDRDVHKIYVDDQPDRVQVPADWRLIRYREETWPAVWYDLERTYGEGVIT